MKATFFHIVIYSMAAISFLGLLIVFPRLPEEIPINWNIYGQVGHYGNKNTIFFLGLLPFLVALLFHILPNIDPKRINYTKHKKAYRVITFSIIFFLISMAWISVAAAFNISYNISRVILIAVGILFLLLGNYLPTIKSNYFIGIRTPWTLANDMVWKKTHKVGGYVFTVCGLLFIVTSLIPGELIFFPIIIILLVAIIWLNIYSYVLYKRF